MNTRQQENQKQWAVFFFNPKSIDFSAIKTYLQEWQKHFNERWAWLKKQTNPKTSNNTGTGEKNLKMRIWKCQNKINKEWK